jgi:hypothetical protein
MAVPKMKTIIFEPMFATTHKILKNKEKVYNPVTGKSFFQVRIEGLPMELEFAPGETLEVTKEQFDALVENGSVLTKKQVTERMKIADKKTPMDLLPRDEKRLLLGEKPQEM